MVPHRTPFRVSSYVTAVTFVTEITIVTGVTSHVVAVAVASVAEYRRDILVGVACPHGRAADGHAVLAVEIVERLLERGATVQPVQPTQVPPTVRVKIRRHRYSPWPGARRSRCPAPLRGGRLPIR